MAGFDVRTGEVIGTCRAPKRQIEFLSLLEKIGRETPAAFKVIHLLCDNVRMHHGNIVRAWLAGDVPLRVEVGVAAS